ncbi:hypothetical protein [Aeromonas salmonicida]|uniref:hypothetical protein n=1 Tax=Aeromonas salmonicida TaxID=645 RepID=UPI00211692B0|nr:hypothetical protein [Aeromonas salmonicida]UUI60383.1 hypothetical protein NP805_20020 [Aeromonas salmonicida]
MKFSFAGKSLATLFIIGLLAGCGGPKDVVLPKDATSWKNNDEVMGAFEKLSEEEKRLFSAYGIRLVMKSIFSGPLKIGSNTEPGSGDFEVKDGLTIGQAIEEQREWENTNKVSK